VVSSKRIILGGDEIDDQPVAAAEFIRPAVAAARLGLESEAWRAAMRAFPMRWPAAYLDLATSAQGAAVRRMGTPDPDELAPNPGDLVDPVGEGVRMEQPFVVRKHRDRALLLVTGRCHFYCRFCFRRAGDHREPSAAELDAALDLLVADRALSEVILSGGDPLVLSDERLRRIVVQLLRSETITTVRVHSRAPVHYPARVTAGLVQALTAGPPVRLVTHFNHATELTPASMAACARLRAAGIPILNQAVLLRGVNDDPATMTSLWRDLRRVGVAPYYLHHPDRAPGNASFRVSIERGLELFATVRSALAPDERPTYVIDLPDGSGKVEVETLERLGPRRWRAGDLTFDDIPAPG